jgi:hypothetical protein
VKYNGIYSPWSMASVLGEYRGKQLGTSSEELFVAALTAVIQMAAPLFYVAMVVNAF